MKDTDCRGGRICNEHGRCMEPPPGSTAGWSDGGAGTNSKGIGLVEGPPPFAMFGGNARNTGDLGGAAPRTRPGPRWEVTFEKPLVGSPTIGPDGTIYVTSHDQHLYAVSPAGKILWRFRTEDRIWSTPAVASDNTVYTGSDDDHLYAVDGKTGKEKWRYRVGRCKDPLGFGPEGTRCDVDGGPTLGPSGTIYVGGDGVYALWPNGTLRWKFATPEHVSTAPALAEDGTVYAGCLDDVFYAIQPDGTKAWDFRTGNDLESSPAIADDGTIYFGGDDDALYALAPDGSQKWRVVTGGDVRASPAIDSDGTIYVGSYDKRLYAVSPKGAVKWRFSAGDKIHGSVGIADNGVILVGAQDDNLYALDKAGQLLWYLPFEADVDATPALSADGTLYVVGDDMKLRAFGL